MTEPLKLVPQPEVDKTDINAACIQRLEETLELAKAKKLTGFAFAATLEDGTVHTGFSARGHYSSLLGCMEWLKQRILEAW